MNKDLPQPSPERLAKLISKHLIPAVQKQPRNPRTDAILERLNKEKDAKEGKTP